MMKKRKDNAIPCGDEHLHGIVIYAMRYALGRATYAPHDVIAFARPLLPHMADKDLFVMARDIQEAKGRGNLGDAAIDAPEWEKFCEEIVQEQERRRKP